MCMEDVRIARSQRVRSQGEIGAAAGQVVTFDVYPRRIRVVITGQSIPRTGTTEMFMETPFVKISTDPTFADATKTIVNQSLYDEFVFDAERFGEAVQGPFSIKIDTDSGTVVGAYAEIELVAKPSEDVPLLQY